MTESIVYIAKQALIRDIGEIALNEQATALCTEQAISRDKAIMLLLVRRFNVIVEAIKSN